jgi:teichuronic acid exporter
MDNLRGRTFSGLKWSAFDRFASQGISFIISIIIARILSPSDYGVVGMIAIFLAISQAFVNGGLGSALIRKQNRTEIDFSTAFYYNIAVSWLFYILLYFSAPWIARFYDTPILAPVTRVVSLNIVIGAIGTMQRIKLTIAIDFKTQAKISIITLLFTGALGIFLAYKGFGVWALIFQQLTSTIINTGLLWYFVSWKPKWVFSLSSFRELFGYGSKLLLTGILDAAYTNIYQMVIGKKYKATDLGYYTRAYGTAQIFSSSITDVIQRVTFPVLSELQEDLPRLTNNYRRLLKMSAFIVFPLMILMTALSEPLIKILLTDKWLPVVPLMQVLCISYMFHPIHKINLNLLMVKGRSDLFLRLDIIQKIMITIVLFVSASFGIFAICLGTLFVSIISLILNTHYTGKMIKLGFWKQMKDIAPAMIISLLAGLIAVTPSFFVENSYLQLIIGGTAGLSFYLGIAFVMKLDEIKEILSFIPKRSRRQAD